MVIAFKKAMHYCRERCDDVFAEDNEVGHILMFANIFSGIKFTLGLSNEKRLSLQLSNEVS